MRAEAAVGVPPDPMEGLGSESEAGRGQMAIRA